MVKRRVGRPRKVGRPRRNGRGIGSILSGVNKFLRKTKAISKIGSLLGSAGVPYASQVSGVAGSLGYGIRRRRRVIRRRRY